LVNIRRMTLTALMAALIFVLTTVPRIPVPATGGYIHLGDAGIAFAACAFGPWVAMAAGGLGTALADLVGFPQWAVFSLIVHGLQGLAMGVIFRKGLNWLTAVVATVFSIVTIVAGYFVAGVLLESSAVAVLEILPNTIQAVSASLIGLPLYWAVRRAYPALESYSERRP
jgi:uncharacterized membrane protein